SPFAVAVGSHGQVWMTATAKYFSFSEAYVTPDRLPNAVSIPGGSPAIYDTLLPAGSFASVGARQFRRLPGFGVLGATEFGSAQTAEYVGQIRGSPSLV